MQPSHVPYHPFGTQSDAFAVAYAEEGTHIYPCHTSAGCHCLLQQSTMVAHAPLARPKAYLLRHKQHPASAFWEGIVWFDCTSYALQTHIRAAIPRLATV